MNKQMLFFLMCVSPVVLNGIFNSAQAAPAQPLNETVEQLQKKVAELSARSQNEFGRGLAVAGTMGAIAYYFLPKAKNRFHYGAGTIGAVAAGYGVNCYYDALYEFAKNNQALSAGICVAAVAAFNHEKVYNKVKDTEPYKWLFSDLA